MMSKARSDVELKETYNDIKHWNREDIFSNHGGEIQEGSIFTLLVLYDIDRWWIKINCFSWFDNIKQAAGYFKYIILADKLSLELDFFDSENRDEFENRLNEFIKSNKYKPNKYKKYIDIWKETDEIFDADPERSKTLFVELIKKFNALLENGDKSDRFLIFENIYDFNAFVNNEFAGNAYFDTARFNRFCCSGQLNSENFLDFMIPLNITCDTKQFYKSSYNKSLHLICCITWIQTSLIMLVSRKIFNGNITQINSFSICAVTFSIFVTVAVIAKAMYTSVALRENI